MNTKGNFGFQQPAAIEERQEVLLGTALNIGLGGFALLSAASWYMSAQVEVENVSRHWSKFAAVSAFLAVACQMGVNATP